MSIYYNVWKGSRLISEGHKTEDDAMDWCEEHGYTDQEWHVEGSHITPLIFLKDGIEIQEAEDEDEDESM